MHWWYLFAAIIFEIMGTLCIKQTTLTNNYYWVGAVVFFYSISFILLGFAVKKIDIGTAYAIWSGFGTATITILGWFLFGEYLNAQKIVAVSLIIAGSVMLRLQHI